MAIYFKGARVIPKGSSGNSIISIPAKYWDIPYLRNVLAFLNTSIGNSVEIDTTKKSLYTIVNIKWSDGSIQESNDEHHTFSKQFTQTGIHVARITDTISSLKVSPNDTLISIDNIAEGLTTFVSDAFKNSTSLKTAVVPLTISSIQPDAFSGCTGLEALYFTGRNESEITSMDNYSSWISNVPSTLIVLVYWKKGSDIGCFVYGHPDAVLLTDEKNDTINLIVTENNDFINKD